MNKYLMLLLMGLPLLAPVAHVWAQEDESAAAPDEENEAATSSTVPTKGKFPRYASLKKGEVNVRSGPGNQYPILWIYQRTGYPVQLLTRYDNYYKIRDAEGEEGWVYITMISGQRTGVVGSVAPTMLYKSDDDKSPVLAKLAPGLNVILKDDVCGSARCKVEAGGYKGWVTKKDLLMVE
ncbi:MAG TPA: SH3 domain-containing protein [Alphaproteobacteria bacterium]|nr:SH3 domain-containing protein [Alphaproteobacteria bacterium]